MNTVKIISTFFDDAKRRLVKILRYGRSDAQTPYQLSPFGVDSNPIKNMVAVYGVSDDKSKTFIIGYINKDQLADVGELRLFSTDLDGAVKTYQWFKKDGTMELMGSDDNMVRYSGLESAFNEFRSDFNAFVQKYNAHVHSGVTTGSGSSAVTTLIADPSSADISGAKIEEIKTLK